MDQTEKNFFTRAQLIDVIKRKTNLPNICGTLAEIQALATLHDIPICFERRNIREGWCNKPKGMLQILWERGFIIPAKDVRFYSVNGKEVNIDSKEIIAGTSLKQIVDRLPDFKEELTLLQFRAKQQLWANHANHMISTQKERLGLVVWMRAKI